MSSWRAADRRRKAAASGVRPGARQSQQTTFQAVLPRAAASGAGGDHAGLDPVLARDWVAFRDRFPARGASVTWTDKPRPGKSEQTCWHHYCQLRQAGKNQGGSRLRVGQEWWLPPFLVPFAGKADVALPQDQALWQGPATTQPEHTGGEEVYEHYTNIHRIERLAEEHPLVLSVAKFKIEKMWDKAIRNDIGRATKYHHSPWDLLLHVCHCVEMVVGCSTHDCAAGLLSLWWKPASGEKLSAEQESVARAVFFDLVEGPHLCPSMYDLELRTAAGQLASATGGASAASGTTPEEPPTAASGAAGSSADGVLLAGGAPSALTGAPQQHASGGDPQSSGAAAIAAPTRGPPRSSLISSRLPEPVLPPHHGFVKPHWPQVPPTPQAASPAAAPPALSSSEKFTSWPPRPPPAEEAPALPQQAASETPPEVPPAPLDAPPGPASGGRPVVVGDLLLPPTPSKTVLEAIHPGAAVASAEAPAVAPQVGATSPASQSAAASVPQDVVQHLRDEPAQDVVQHLWWRPGVAYPNTERLLEVAVEAPRAAQARRAAADAATDAGAGSAAAGAAAGAAEAPEAGAATDAGSAAAGAAAGAAEAPEAGAARDAGSPSPPSAQAPASAPPAPKADDPTPPSPKEAQLSGDSAEGESTASEAARSSDKAPRGLPLSAPPQVAALRREKEIHFELALCWESAAESEAAASAPPAAPMPAPPASAAAAPADSGPTPAAKPAPSRPGFGNYRRDADQEARDAAELDDWAARAHAEKVAAAAARASGDAGAGSSQTGGAHVQQSLRDTLGDDRRLGNRGRGSTRHPPEQQSDGEHSGWESSSSVTPADDGREQRRTRPRSRSVQRPVAPGAASGAPEAEGTRDVDHLKQRIPYTRLAQLSDADKLWLRQVEGQGRPQWHIDDQRVRALGNIAGFRDEAYYQPERRERVDKVLVCGLNWYLDPIPSCYEFIQGIPHKNDRDEYAGELWNVVRALGSRKMHYLGKLQRDLWPEPPPWPDAPFNDAYPDAVFDKGKHALQPWALDVTKQWCNATSDYDYVKHILNKHDGEVRHWGPFEWHPLPRDVDFTNLRFWHYQFAKTDDVREELLWYHLNWREGKLPMRTINRILAAEGGETRLLKRVPGAHPASGGTWYIVSGQCVTLAELFEFGCHACSCHFLYRLYVNQPLFISKQKKKSIGGSPEAIMRKNARSLRYQEKGCHGLPSWTS